MDKLSNLQEILLILTGLKSQIEQALRSIQAEERIKDEDLKFTVANYLHILICNFNEEWHRFEGLGFDNAVKKSLIIASPVVDRIKKWSGLNKIRSSLLTHPHRNKNGTVAFPWDIFAKNQAPTAYAETILIGNCAIMAIKVALLYHNDEYIIARDYILAQTRQIETKGIQTVGQIKTELKKINEEIKQKAIENP
ncbi:hypothetical protein ACFL5U_02345 [Candidatus Margulisiibacteriota bacterium]